MQDYTRVSVIIPNWNGARQLAKVLESLSAQTLVPSRILVVDNGSADDSPAVARQFGAELLSLPANLGFCAAVNTGLRQCSGHPWVAILNNDVVLRPDWLEKLLAAADDRYMFAAGMLLRMDKPDELDGSFDLISRGGCAWRAGHGRPNSQEWKQPEEIAFPPFTAVLVRRELFDRVGMLDERFESYLEDVDFGFRCALRNLRGIYVPDAVAHHQGGATLGAWSPAMVRLLSRNQLYLVARHYPENWARRYARQIILGQGLWGLLALRRGTFLAWLRGKWEGVRGFHGMRGPVVQVPPDEFDRMLRQSERRIHLLQSRTGFDWFWRNYFRWCGGAA